MKSMPLRARELLVGILIIAVAVLIFWWVLSAASTFFLGLDKAVASAIVAGTATIFGILFAYWKDRRKTAEEAHREKKISVYTPFLDIIFIVMKKSNSNITPDQANDPAGEYLRSTEFFDSLIEIKKGMTFYGSPDVIKAMNAWQSRAGKESNGLVIMKLVGDLLLAMRKDIGLSNKGLNNLSILQMNIIEDIEALKVTA